MRRLFVALLIRSASLTVRSRPTTMTKSRTQVPATVAAEILFSSDNTCCICQERGKFVQIHHLA